MFETIENLCETVAPLQVEVWTSPEPLPFERRFEGTFQKLEIGRSWGSLFDCGWFRFSGTVPPGERPEELALRLDVNGELLMALCAVIGTAAAYFIMRALDPKLSKGRWEQKIISVTHPEETDAKE